MKGREGVIEEGIWGKVSREKSRGSDGGQGRTYSRRKESVE